MYKWIKAELFDIILTGSGKLLAGPAQILFYYFLLIYNSLLAANRIVHDPGHKYGYY